MPHYSQHAESRLVIRDVRALKRWISFLPIPVFQMRGGGGVPVAAAAGAHALRHSPEFRLGNSYCLDFVTRRV